MTTTELKSFIEDYIADRLEEDIFEDILEDFDITPAETFLLLVNSGLIDLDEVSTTCAASARLKGVSSVR